MTFNRTHYFIDKGQQRGLTYESLKLFEDDLNTARKTGNLKINVVFVPLPRDQLYPALINGKVDMVAAMVTVTPEREKLVAFSDPTRTNVNEVVVTAPGAKPIATLDDLAGREVFIRKLSIYNETVAGLNAQLKSRGKPPVIVKEAPEVFEDDDLLEMVNAGLVDATIVDDYLADFWGTVFKELTVHKDVPVRTGGTLAVAMRKENPKLREAVNAWMKKHGDGDAFRNTIERRYLVTGKFAKNAASTAERKKLEAIRDLFKKYGAQYNLDYLLMAAQGYQESTLDQSARNPSGAIGVMQVLPVHRQGPQGRRHHPDRAQHPRRREVHPVHDGRVLRRRPDGPAEQGADDVRGLQRGAGTDQRAAARSGEARPRSQRLVRQRRARGVREDRARDRAVRQQHLQVLRRLQAGRPSRCRRATPPGGRPLPNSAVSPVCAPVTL